MFSSVLNAVTRILRRFIGLQRQPCLKPLRKIVWKTAEEMDRDGNKRWQDMGNGVFWMVGEYDSEAD